PSRPRRTKPSPSRSRTTARGCPAARRTRASRSSTAGSPPAAGAPASASRSVRASSRRTAGASGPRTRPRGASRSFSRCRRPRSHRPRCTPMPDPVVVLIEDEPQIRRFLRATLTGQGYRLFEATTGADGLVEVGSRQPDVVIVDLGLPDIDGIDVIRRLREWTAVPIIVLSARGQERDKVTALDVGADDYVSKPFGADELLARIRVALRHTAGASHEGDDATFQVGALRMDLLRRQVFVGDREVRLTPIEYKLLAALVRHAGKVVTHAQLLRDVWGPTHTDQAPYVRVYLAHLPHKLQTEPARPGRRAAASRASSVCDSCARRRNDGRTRTAARVESRTHRGGSRRRG